MKIKEALSIFLIISCAQSFPQNGKFQFQVSYDQVVFPFYDYDYENGFSYKISGDVTYYISKRISISSGISYESDKYNIVYPTDENNVIWLVEENYKYTYVEFPLIFGFEVLNLETHSLAFRSGFERNRLIDAIGVLRYSNGTTRNALDGQHIYRTTNCFLFGLKYCYFPCQKLFIGITPKLRYNLSFLKGEDRKISYLLQLSIGYELTK